MVLAGLTLAAVLARCAPNVAPRTLASVVSVESGGDPLAIHDNDTGRSFRPVSLDGAVALAGPLVARGDSVDLGLAQINSANLSRVRLTVRDAFDPCANARAAGTILGEAYARSSTRFGSTPLALWRAFGAYNTGRLDAGDGYAAAVVAAARRVVASVPPRVPDVASAGLVHGAAFSTPAFPVARRRVRVTPARARVVRRTSTLQAHDDPRDAPILVTAAASPPPADGAAAGTFPAEDDARTSAPAGNAR